MKQKHTPHLTEAQERFDSIWATELQALTFWMTRIRQLTHAVSLSPIAGGDPFATSAELMNLGDLAIGVHENCDRMVAWDVAPGSRALLSRSTFILRSVLWDLRSAAAGVGDADGQTEPREDDDPRDYAGVCAALEAAIGAAVNACDFLTLALRTDDCRITS